MSQLPSELRYTASHEWIRRNDDGSLTVGITDHAQEQLGDLVFVELPEVGTHYAAGAECCIVESVKAASDIYCPAAGTVSAANTALQESPEQINSDPYGEGWILQLAPDDAQAFDGLLDAAGYQAAVDAESH
jgi:glycine cleavage system H protein